MRVGTFSMDQPMIHVAHCANQQCAHIWPLFDFLMVAVKTADPHTRKTHNKSISTQAAGLKEVLLLSGQLHWCSRCALLSWTLSTWTSLNQIFCVPQRELKNRRFIVSIVQQHSYKLALHQYTNSHNWSGTYLQPSFSMCQFTSVQKHARRLCAVVEW